MRISVYLLPLVHIYLRKKGVALQLHMYPGKINTVHPGQSHPVNLFTPDNKGLIVMMHLPESLIQRMHHNTTLRRIIGIAGNEDVGTPRQRLAIRFKGSAPHNHMMAPGGLLEVFEVIRQMPQQIVTLPYYMVIRCCYDQ